MAIRKTRKAFLPPTIAIKATNRRRIMVRPGRHPTLHRRPMGQPLRSVPLPATTMTTVACFPCCRPLPPMDNTMATTKSHASSLKHSLTLFLDSRVTIGNDKDKRSRSRKQANVIPRRIHEASEKDLVWFQPSPNTSSKKLEKLSKCMYVCTVCEVFFRFFENGSGQELIQQEPSCLCCYFVSWFGCHNARHGWGFLLSG
mmetsp:Transcript_31370/g.65473  ORF Transcript_31370/g.65473 Transcript_31370/m.65473 type:complete len:200 (+) Transcript_31370:934-1533(+)